MRTRKYLCLSTVTLLLSTMSLFGQGSQYDTDKFRQLEEILPTPNGTRAASGAPAPGYWQQTADYVIHVELDDENQRIIGSEVIHYTNRSPDTLTYLWLQLDNNSLHAESAGFMTESAPIFEDKGTGGSKSLPFKTSTGSGGVGSTAPTTRTSR